MGNRVARQEEIHESVKTAEDSEPAEDTEEGFKARMMQLYDLYGDWTGEAEDEDGESAETQSDGSPVVEPSVALTTLAVFLIQVARDLEVEDAQFDAIIGDLRTQLAASENEGGGAENDGRGSTRDVA